MTNTYYIKIQRKNLQKESREKYQNLSEEEKDKKGKYLQERYRNLSEEEKKRSVNMVAKDIRIF